MEVKKQKFEGKFGYVKDGLLMADRNMIDETTTYKYTWHLSKDWDGGLNLVLGVKVEVCRGIGSSFT